MNEPALLFVFVVHLASRRKCAMHPPAQYHLDLDILMLVSANLVRDEGFPIHRLFKWSPNLYPSSQTFLTNIQCMSHPPEMKSPSGEASQMTLFGRSLSDYSSNRTYYACAGFISHELSSTHVVARHLLPPPFPLSPRRVPPHL